MRPPGLATCFSQPASPSQQVASSGPSWAVNFLGQWEGMEKLQPSTVMLAQSGDVRRKEQGRVQGRSEQGL